MKFGFLGKPFGPTSDAGWTYLAIAAIAVVLGIFFWNRLQKMRPTDDGAGAANRLDDNALELDLSLGPIRSLALGTLPNCKIAYRQIGDGSDILCLHGIGASMMIYRRLVPLLSRQYRVTCMDFPGFGESEKSASYDYALDSQAERLTAFVQTLPLNRPLVIASSMGGAIALAALTAHPWARGLVALAPAVEPRRVPSVFLPLANHGEHFFRLRFNNRAFVRTIAKRVVSKKELLTPSVIDAYHSPFKKDPLAAAAFFKAFRLLADRRMPDLFRDLKVSLLILYGQRDRLVSLNACRTLCRTVVGAKLAIHPTAGHHVMEDEPEWTAEQIIRFDSDRAQVEA